MLGDFLVDRGLLSRRSIDDTLGQAEGKPLYEALQGLGLIDEDELRRAAAHAMGVLFVEIPRHEIEPGALFLIPEPLARAHNLMAYRLGERGLEVALLDLADLQALEPLHLSHKVLPRLTSRKSLTHGLIYYQKLLKEKFAAILGHGGDAVEALLHHALLSRAHGVHIDLKTTGTLVRYRIGHALNDAMELPAHVGKTLADKLKLLAKLLPASPEHQRGEPTSRTVQEGRFKFEVRDNLPATQAGERHAVHVFSGTTALGERLTLRLARESAGHGGFTLEALGLHGKAQEDLNAALFGGPGLVVVAGPVGSGVTTLLYTLLDLLSTPHHALATVEETVEHRLPHVMQVETDTAAGVDTEAALRAVLKTDPSVVMVANLGDSRAAALAASAAARGVLVLAGIEARSATDGVEKLSELGVQPLTLASTLRAVVATRVVTKLPADAVRYFPTRTEFTPLEVYADFGRILAALKEEGAIADGTRWKYIAFVRSRGGEEAAGAGLIGLQEVLPITEPIKELIYRGAGAVDIEVEARAEGILSIIEDGLFKAAQGITSIEEVSRLLEE